MPSFELLAIICLIALAFGDLFVGVVNDAVNFLNSAIGSKVSSKKVIIGVAAVGILIGATFSDGIIEVARKGIFHPEMFGATEAIIIFTAVAFADIILLDLYSTFGLPTSTTVSLVFELLGAAFILALWKMGGISEAWTVINSESAIKIIVGIVMSIGVAFVAGLVVQFLTRLWFSFDYKEKFKRWGGVWSGIALSCLVLFVLMKGAAHASFMTGDVKEWIGAHTFGILGGAFVIFLVLSYLLMALRVNVLKLIVLIGTASLAMAFAGNDLANFIGVSVAGTHAFLGAELVDKLPTPTWVLLLSGIVMVIALATSKKANTVTGTSIALASHGKEVKSHWKTNGPVEKLADMVHAIYRGVVWLLPDFLVRAIASRWKIRTEKGADNPPFDLLRAAVNLMVAAAVISYATSQKLPLSTTYVTFMVAMGTALADRSWGRDCAPCRIVGVMTVIGGWFFTGIMAFVMAGATVSVLYLLKGWGLALLLAVVLLTVYKLAHVHEKRRL